jgi:hypothetical protein
VALAALILALQLLVRLVQILLFQLSLLLAAATVAVLTLLAVGMAVLEVVAVWAPPVATETHQAQAQHKALTAVMLVAQMQLITTAQAVVALAGQAQVLLLKPAEMVGLEQHQHLVAEVLLMHVAEAVALSKVSAVVAPAEPVVQPVLTAVLARVIISAVRV